MPFPGKPLFVLCLVVFSSLCSAQTVLKPLWQNDAFAVFPDRVVQNNRFIGKALSPTALTSNYKSPANEFLSPSVTFKFSINGKDNEMISGMDHHFVVDKGPAETPPIPFGKQLVGDRPLPDNTYLKPQTAFTINLDMRAVLQAFENQGYYTTYNGDKIYKQDFKGVYVAGSTAPLMWDFNNLANRPGLQLEDKDGDGIFRTTIMLNDPKEEKSTSAAWTLSKDLSAFPAYRSGYPLSDALYNLALEEMQKAVEPDSTFRTGKEWSGVWTRDVSYSIILSMAHLQPKVSRYSLMRKVNRNGRIIQDTGTGGAWPASSDRMIWAVAAWELYAATGDEDWLKQAYSIIRASLEDDYKVVYDPATGLVKGESSFLDWREQTYPAWMQPADIYESECLGTNAVHYQVNTVLARMAERMGDRAAAQKYTGVAQRIKEGINKYLWMPDKGYYGQYLYGRHAKILSPRSEALGEALCVLFGIAGKDREKDIIRKTPVMNFGIPCIYPQIPNIPPYHNNAVWPFVQSYWALAAARAGNEEAVLQSISAIYRPAALWGTNKENFVGSNGDFSATQINSSNMLWSLSGSIGLIHKIIFGMEFTADGLAFRPFVPAALKGGRSLKNFTYRKAVLDIELEGYGNTIRSFTLDGQPSAAIVPADLEGRHRIRIVLANNKPGGRTNTVSHYVTLPAPVVRLEGNTLSWQEVKGAVSYKLLQNGKEAARMKKPGFPVHNSACAEYGVIAVDARGVESFASEPVLVVGQKAAVVYELERAAEKASLPHQGFSGSGFVEISKAKNTTLSFPVTIAEEGVYAIDFRYANGNGPINTENKCALRTLKSGADFLGTVVLPQRGKGEWSAWGWSNAVQTTLSKGRHTLSLSFEPYNENMNGDINEALLDYVRIIKIK
ncbi:hypothetical protein V9K67_15700 [Paraflavisolibacter sp. H34]|uniref:alpha-L-rhamnosidase-related protein n=1 Tax=Huijunlia imazamoxiresistens TaxID=3127457 RepID=UPI00301ACA76